MKWSKSQLEVLNRIKANKKQFILECAKQSRVQTLYTCHATTGWQMEVYVRYHQANPNYGDKILAIGRGLHMAYITEAAQIMFGTGGRLGVKGWASQDTVDFFEKLYDKYWEQAIIPKAWEMNEDDLLHNTFTEDLKELLARGFIHIHDSPDMDEGDFFIYHNRANLIWPKGLSSKTYALELVYKWGVTGCTIKIN
jgi:hypothetical protein